MSNLSSCSFRNVVWSTYRAIDCFNHNVYFPVNITPQANFNQMFVGNVRTRLCGIQDGFDQREDEETINESTVVLIAGCIR